MVWSPYGRFACGIAEVEWLRTAGQGLSGRLYYPAPSELKATAAPPSSWLRPWTWRRGVPWLWDVQYARGLGKFLFFRLHGFGYDVLKQMLIGLNTALGKSQRMDLVPGAPLAPDAPQQLPLVVFSHGLGGNRFLYSIICSELASQGYLVLAVEHNDGSASAVRLPGGEWRLYGGLGDEEAQVAKTRVRVREMQAALHLMQALHRGDRLSGVELSYGLDAPSFLKGRIDLRCVAAAGHSYGGATTTALVAEDPLFRCGVALDPWWHAVYPESPALDRFQTRTPLLVVGSHDWNVPNAWGQLSCGGERQQKILAAARQQGGSGQEGGRTGGGAMLLSIAGSSHNTFADFLPLFGQKTGWLLERLGLSARLDPLLGIHLSCTALLHFLSLHLPLTKEQREAQNWEPAKGHLALDAIKARDAADAAGASPASGPLSWLFPGRGLMLGVSDFLIDLLLPKRGTFRPVSGGGPPPGLAKAAPTGNGAEEPDDVVTGAEAAEAALPSAGPASGPHPHAPSKVLAAAGAAGNAAGAAGGEGAAVGQLAGPAVVLGAEQRAELRAGVNKRYSAAVQAAEVEEMHALLGSEHIFICRTV
ncbi:hypothetical protein COHA_009666 [Chlorella ohadii]|uniref:1-alkyl-2-acetylglycerophosphocholine esterase n=1 Tax=Chlorella ohadii TaxID=2649997 RepID=A0AAD5GXW4_9CHLO|nr:hypothetical protein COHA_009666 [Chlorella ohadii]